jgi:hypothetical protein
MNTRIIVKHSDDGEPYAITTKDKNREAKFDLQDDVAVLQEITPQGGEDSVHGSEITRVLHLVQKLDTVDSVEITGNDYHDLAPTVASDTKQIQETGDDCHEANTVKPDD